MHKRKWIYSQFPWHNKRGIHELTSTNPFALNSRVRGYAATQDTLHGRGWLNGSIMSVSQDPEVATENHLLPVDVYQFWVTAIVSDDPVQVESVLTAADEPQRRLLLNGSFHFQDEELLRHNKYAFGGRPNKPLAPCALSGPLRVLRVLLGHGVDVTSQDTSGHNIVHQLIFLVYYDETFDERFVPRDHGVSGFAIPSDGGQRRASAAGSRLAARLTALRARDHGDGGRVPRPTGGARSQHLPVV